MYVQSKVKDNNTLFVHLTQQLLIVVDISHLNSEFCVIHVNFKHILTSIRPECVGSF